MAGIVEFSVHGQVLSAVEELDELLPPIGVTLLQRRAHLPHGLCREQEPSAGIVEDLPRQLELAPSPGNDRFTWMRLELFGAKDLHLDD